MKKSMKNLRFLVGGMLTVLAVAGITGCEKKPDAEEVITESITNELESIKALDEETLKEMSVDELTEEFAPYGIDGEEYMRTYLEGFDYTLGEVTVDGDTAETKVTLKCKSYQDLEAGIENAVTEMMENPEELLALTGEEINLKIGEVIMGVIEETDAKETEPITITYEQKDGTWSESEDTEDVVADALMNH
ncbi:hypothetical protein [uncultured Merdimonas sp.]|uniref:hypothetical protein n=1 Tax=uncultured Merdimonas sp. TaxID=2023269 RepID=UPI0032089AE8